MIEPNLPDLSVSKQCQLLSISRSSFYYEPKGESELNLDLMRLIDRQFLETPLYGVRQMTWHLRNEDHLVNEKRIRRLMRLMGLMPIYQKPNTSKTAKGHKTYPYLLRGLRVDRPNQVWCADITYLPPLGRFAGQIACRAMLGGRPPAVVYWQRIETTNPDQQEQRVAQFTPGPVRNTGTTSLLSPSTRAAD